MGDIKGSITRGFGKAKLTATKYSPEITMVSSIIFGTIALGTAIHSTLKVEKVIDRHINKMEKINKLVEDGVTELEDDETGEVIEFTPKVVARTKAITYVKTGWELTKLYAPTIIFGAGAIACTLASHKILTKRNAALAATAALLKKEWDEYRSRVVRDLGTEMDRHFLYDTVENVVEKTVTDEKTGKEKKVKEKVQTPTKGSVYSRIFDEANKYYSKDGAASYLKIRSQLLDFNRHIVRDGYAFLNNGYGKMGFPITIAGQQAGWVYDPNRPEQTLCQIEGFGIVKVSSNGTVYLDDETESAAVRAFRNGYERSCLLEFKNIRDNIFDDIRAVDSEIMAI